MIISALASKFGRLVDNISPAHLPPILIRMSAKCSDAVLGPSTGATPQIHGSHIIDIENHVFILSIQSRHCVINFDYRFSQFISIANVNGLLCLAAVWAERARILMERRTTR